MWSLYNLSKWLNNLICEAMVIQPFAFINIHVEFLACYFYWANHLLAMIYIFIVRFYGSFIWPASKSCWNTVDQFFQIIGYRRHNVNTGLHIQIWSNNNWSMCNKGQKRWRESNRLETLFKPFLPEILKLAPNFKFLAKIYRTPEERLSLIIPY